MTTPNIPRGQANALMAMQIFSAGLSASPARYGVSAADSLAVQKAVDAYSAALSLARDPLTRTAVTVRDKDTARNAAEQIWRQFYSLIKPNAGVSDGDKIAIGVRPVNRDRTPIQCPTTSPLLKIIAATPMAHTIRYNDSFTPKSRAKPFGATELQLFVTINDGPADFPDGEPIPESQDDSEAGAGAARLVGKYTRNPIGVDFKSKDEGKRATYYARWASRRGDVGPWSLAVSMRIAG